MLIAGHFQRNYSILFFLQLSRLFSCNVPLNKPLSPFQNYPTTKASRYLLLKSAPQQLPSHFIKFPLLCSQLHHSCTVRMINAPEKHRRIQDTMLNFVCSFARSYFLLLTQYLILAQKPQISPGHCGEAHSCTALTGNCREQVRTVNKTHPVYDSRHRRAISLLPGTSQRVTWHLLAVLEGKLIRKFIYC